MDFTIKESVLTPSLEAVLKYSDGTAVDLTGATVQFTFRKMFNPSVTTTGTAAIVAPSTGEVRYDWQTGDTDVPGVYEAEWVVTFPDTRTGIFPSSGRVTFLISKKL